MINQQYSHIAAFALAAVLGAEIVLPPAAKRDSFAHYFSVFKEQVSRVPMLSGHCGAVLSVDIVLWASQHMRHARTGWQRLPQHCLHDDSVLQTCSLSVSLRNDVPVATRQNEVSWTAAPLESLMDVDSIVNGWRSKGMTVHKVCAARHLVTRRPAQYCSWRQTLAALPTLVPCSTCV